MAMMDTIKGWFSSQKIDEAPVVKKSGGGGLARDPLATVIKKIGLALGITSRDFLPPEFDLTQITTGYNTEAYVRQSVDKYIEMMFKAGWDIIGKNQASVDYIKLRLTIMAEMSQLPTDQLFIEIAEDLVKYSNAIIVKARDSGGLIASTGAPLNVVGLAGQPPVAGYFPLNVTTMAVRRDKTGSVKGWQQTVVGGDKPIKFKTDDIVHIYYKREKGNAFGTPFLMPVLDDIRALRQAEETVLKLIFRNLNPLLHIKVGTDELPGQSGEIDNVKTEFEGMTLEAGFVTSERVTVSAIASDKVIDAKDYLKYFEQRVFTGLGVSELMMGRGNTANRSTGDNLSGEFTDRVKAFQKVMAIFVDQFIIKELLMEGGFDPVLNPLDDVDFVFKEIDVDAKIKAENHAIFQYEHNSITEDEMRALLGRDPITDRALMFMSLVTIPVAEATAAAKAAASPTAGTPAANNKNKPTNQHGTKPSPKTKASTDSEFKTKYLESLERTFESSQSAVSKLIDAYLKTNSDQHLTELANVIRYTEEDLVSVMQHHLGIDYAKDFTKHIHKVCQRLHEETVDTIGIMNGNDRSRMIHETISGVYDVLQMRVVDIAIHAYDAYVKIGNEEVEQFEPT
jgi:hypothetical protein